MNLIIDRSWFHSEHPSLSGEEVARLFEAR
jgi:hypothetical protein